MQKLRPLLSLLLLGGLCAHASSPITPTTTLANEKSNNTSAASTFVAQSNGNAGSGNISKLPIRSLLYDNSNTKIYAHWMPWFGTSSHMNVGYNSADPAQVSKQVTDMMSRGIDGAVADWYGPNNTHINTATLYMKKYAEASGGKFVFAIMEDVGALKSCASTAGCDVTARAISDLTYVYNTYESSPAYMRINGRPVVFFFGTEAYNLDWNRIRANTPGNPLFIFRNSGGFTKLQSNGAYSWVGISSTNPNSMGLSYLDDFYSTALKRSASVAFGSSYKGFNDTLSSWGKNRIVNQQCGQTWLATFAEAGKYYSETNQLPSLQIVTWNDYEEGTEFETGIDNCVTVSGSTSSNTINWSITGQENTVDHYTVFISLDGENLMPVADVPAGTRSLDLSQFSFDPANYILYVKAVGKPSLTNKMSGPIAWSLADVPPVANLSVTPSSGIAPISVVADASASAAMSGTIKSTTIDFGDGAVVSGASASHTYSVPGTYTITAEVMDSFGGVGRSTGTVTVVANQAPSARLTITPGSGIAPLTVWADASSSTDADGKIVSTVIDFGDGSSVNTSSGSRTISTPGVYNITATVTDDRGAQSMTSATLTVVDNKPPVASLSVTPSTGIAPVTVTADASASTDADGKIVSAILDFGDGTIVTGAVATHVYSAAGTYNVSATVVDDLGAGAATSSRVTITQPNQPPTVSVSVSPTTVVAGANVNAKVYPNDPDGTIASTSINWGDGVTTSWPAMGSHVYSKAGVYTVTVTTIDNLGAKTSASTSVTVNWGVLITAPVAGTSNTSPVRVAAKVSAPVSVTCIKIYLDNVAVYSINNVSQIDTYVNMAVGTRYVVVQAWDASGVVYKSSLYVTVK